MRYLIDTLILIWFLEGNPSLSSKTVNILSDPRNQMSVSIASLWEITIKTSIGKLKLSKSLPEIIQQMEKEQVEILQIENPHLLVLLSLPFHHNDPFDRLLINNRMTFASELLDRLEKFLILLKTCLSESSEISSPNTSSNKRYSGTRVANMNQAYFVGLV
jgi:PIN domain nuclease of toxin-antitoxin system